MNMIDLSPLVGAGIEFLSAVLLALGSYAIWKLSNWLKLKEDSEVRAYLDDALAKAIDYGRAEAAKLGRKAAVEIENKTVAEAVNYAIERVPDALTRFGITPDALAAMIRARLVQ